MDWQATTDALLQRAQDNEWFMAARKYMEIPKLSADETCVKCGAVSPQLSHRALGIDGTVAEYMAATCWRCGWRWLRLPLDAENAQQATRQPAGAHETCKRDS